MSEKRKTSQKKMTKVKSDVGKLMKTISNLRPLEELTISNERLQALARKSFNTQETEESDYESDSVSRFSFRRPISRKGSGISSGVGDSSLFSLVSKQDSLFSEVSQSSKLTQRELLSEIDRRAKKNRPPPEYIQPLDQLDPSLISWNRKLTRAKTFHSEPQINIIGCLHPVELILAKADKRSRKRQQTLIQKQIKCEERTKEIDEAIQWKFTRAERYAALLALRQRQVTWIRSLLLVNYMRQLKVRFEEKYNAQKEFQKVAKYARMVTKAFYRWYRRHLWKKLNKNADVFHSVRNKFAMYIRLYRKRRAVARIKQFFTDFKGHHKMNIVVHKYLQSVKTVQRIIRDFLACKQGKILAVTKLWEKYEFQYIKKKLEQKRKKMQETQLAKRSSDKNLSEIGNRQYIEMKQQAQLWAKIDSKVENMVNQLKTQGVIVDEDEAEVIQRLMLPADIRTKAIKLIIERSRKEFYAGQRTIIKKRVEMDATFQEHHALALLRGQNDNLNRIINEKFNKKLVNLHYKPFMLFSTLDRKMVWEKMKEAHNINETFKIKINNVEDRKKSIAVP